MSERADKVKSRKGPPGSRPKGSQSASQGLPFWDPRKVLEFPPVYNSFQKLLGADLTRRTFIEENIAPLGSGRMLEVGCGPGTNCAWIPKGMHYVGCDLNDAYIRYAQKHFGDRAEFYGVAAGELCDLDLKPFRVVVAMALLHHLDDSEVLAFCHQVHPLLEKNGVFITGDPCFLSEQGKIERWITKQDRGRFVRFPEQYRALLSKAFPRVEMQIIRHKSMLIPNSGVTLKAYF